MQQREKQKKAERMVFTKLGSQMERGAVTNVGNIKWGAGCRFHSIKSVKETCGFVVDMLI